MANDCFKPKFPKEIEAKIRTIADETGATYDDVVNLLMRSFFETVDDSGKKEVPSLVVKVREALLKSKAGSG